jgi:hypothetical protein
MELKGLIIYIKKTPPLNQKLRTKPKGFYANFVELPYMGKKLFA